MHNLIQSGLLKKVQGHVNILPQFRTNVSLYESVIFRVPGKLWNFLESKMLYDKCIGNKLWSYPVMFIKD